MQVDAFMIARAAEVHDGLLHALGAGWTRCWPGPGQQYPCTINLPVFASLRVAPGDMGTEHRFVVAARDAEGVLLGPAAIEGAFVCAADSGGMPDMSQLVHISGTLRADFPSAGIYAVVLSIDGNEAHRIEIAAVPGPA